MVKINIGNAVKVSFGNKKKEENKPPAPVPDKRCPVCGNYAPGTMTEGPRCRSKMG